MSHSYLSADVRPLSLQPHWNLELSHYMFSTLLCTYRPTSRQPHSDPIKLCLPLFWIVLQSRLEFHRPIRKTSLRTPVNRYKSLLCTFGDPPHSYPPTTTRLWPQQKAAWNFRKYQRPLSLENNLATSSGETASDNTQPPLPNRVSRKQISNIFKQYTFSSLESVVKRKFRNI